MMLQVNREETYIAGITMVSEWRVAYKSSIPKQSVCVSDIVDWCWLGGRRLATTKVISKKLTTLILDLQT